MNLHKHARLTPRGRVLLVQRVLEHGLRVEEAEQFGVLRTRHGGRLFSKRRTAIHGTQEKLYKQLIDESFQDKTLFCRRITLIKTYALQKL
ncbi:MAG TPA: leucine zipper domain-containing protein [Terriglobales bacterium]